jgi:GntR family transcriptional regulator, carbon starvation induced regulator
MEAPERADLAAGVGDDGYRRIRNDIIFGRLKPGQRLRLEAMRAEYGASISTLREVLSRLAAEALVLAEGRRGFEVAGVSAADLRDLAALRLLLETAALERSFARGDMEWEGRVVSAHHKLAATERHLGTRRGDPRQWKRYDGEFHHALISNCGSRALLETHAAVFDRYFRYQMLVMNHRGEEPQLQHRRLLECALARDAARAKAVLAEHVENCVAHALAAGLLA